MTEESKRVCCTVLAKRRRFLGRMISFGKRCTRTGHFLAHRDISLSLLFGSDYTSTVYSTEYTLVNARLQSSGLRRQGSSPLLRGDAISLYIYLWLGFRFCVLARHDDMVAGPGTSRYHLWGGGGIYSPHAAAGNESGSVSGCSADAAGRSGELPQRVR